MVDWVKALKLETGAELDFAPTEVDPLDDGLLSMGIAIEDVNTTIEKDGSNNMIFKDAVTGTKTLSDLATPSITNLDGGVSSPTYGGVAISPIDGGASV